MPADYRRDVQYERSRTSRANPPLPLATDLLDVLEDLHDVAQDNLDGSCASFERLDKAVGRANDLINAAGPALATIHALADALSSGKDGTWNMDGALVSFDSGYQVGGVVPPLTNPTFGETVAFIERALQLRDTGDLYLGAWTDPQGQLVIDISERIFSRVAARLTAFNRGETAVWNWHTKDSLLTEAM
jgi:hypothetical protein